MDITCDSKTPAPIVVNEIKYYMTFLALKKLLELEKITLENCRKANVAIAEKYGVLEYHI